jgi:hypothetical protein
VHRGPRLPGLVAAVANSGYLPAYISKRALERKVARGVVFNIHRPEGAGLAGGVHCIVGPQLIMEPPPPTARWPMDRARPARRAHRPVGGGRPGRRGAHRG